MPHSVVEERQDEVVAVSASSSVPERLNHPGSFGSKKIMKPTYGCSPA
jgi:hypothetical protein